jgi:hypothetical protein
MAGSVRISGTDPHALRYEDLVADITFMEQDSQLLSGPSRKTSAWPARTPEPMSCMRQ